MQTLITILFYCRKKGDLARQTGYSVNLSYIYRMRQIVICIALILCSVNNLADAAGPVSSSSVNFDLYSAAEFAETGLSREVFHLAVNGLQKLDSLGKLQNPNIVTIVDYSQSSNKKRLYVIDVPNRRLLFNTYVAHGRNSGNEFAQSFSNEEGSLKSSLGFYITELPINGSHTGFALMLQGVEKGFNDNASKREIIMHAANYATEDFIKKNGRLGRSLGCPSLPPEMNKPIIETIKGGTCLFVYNPNDAYICQSSLLH